MIAQTQKMLLCLDLEGTLISNAVSQLPRPGLYQFLMRVSEVCDLMIYTSVSSARVNAILSLLVEEQVAPAWFADLPVIHPKGTIKFKDACGRTDALLLDDQRDVIASGEEAWWVPIPEYIPPYSQQDRELEKAFIVVKARVTGA